MSVDSRFLTEVGQQVFRNSELPVKGMLEVEGGVQLVTGCPGGGPEGVFACLQQLAPLLIEHGVRAQLAGSDAIAGAMLYGARMAGCRGLAVVNTAGLARAAEPVLSASLTAAPASGACVLLVIDSEGYEAGVLDPRSLCEHLGIALLTPGSAQAVKDNIPAAFRLARSTQLPVAVRVSPRLMRVGGSVTCYATHFPARNEAADRAVAIGRDQPLPRQKGVPYLEQRGPLSNKLPARHETLLTEARHLAINRIDNRPRKDEISPMGFVAAGADWMVLRQALAEMGLSGRLPILFLGMTQPIDGLAVERFAAQCESLIVIEQGPAILQRQIAGILATRFDQAEAMGKLFGKVFPYELPGVPAAGPVNVDTLIERLAPLLRQHPGLPLDYAEGRLAELLERIKARRQVRLKPPQRTPTFCAGCPHRDGASVLHDLIADFRNAEYMLARHKRKPVDLLVHGDAGCSSLLRHEPHNMLHSYAGPGLGAGVGSGADGFVENKQLVLLGDGTFFSTGHTAISHAIQTSQDVTFLIGDNGSAAKTAQLPHSGTDIDLLGRTRHPQDIERTVKGMIPKSLAKDVRIVRIDPTERERYRTLLEQSLMGGGVNVIIADKECGITYHARAQKEERQTVKEFGYLPRKAFMNVATDVCEYCFECTRRTSCPGLTIVDTEMGRKMQTDLSACVTDGACQRLHACPAFEEVTVVRKRGQVDPSAFLLHENVPDPPRPLHAAQEIWRCAVAGVGGTGVTATGWLLARAGQLMGYEVQLVEDRGDAVQTAPAVARLVFSRPHGEPAPARPASVTDEAVAAFEFDEEQQRPPARTNPGATPPAPQPNAYGEADVLIGLELTEAARVADGQSPWRVASPDRTAGVINTSHVPTVGELTGDEQPDLRRLGKQVRDQLRRDVRFTFGLGQLCERVLGSRQRLNLAMVGAALQLGLLPLTEQAIEEALAGSVPREELESHRRALRLGRLVVANPKRFAPELGLAALTPRQLLRRKLVTLRKRYGRIRGRVAQRQLFRIAYDMRRAGLQKQLPVDLQREIVVRLYRCMLWGGEPYARDYAAQVQRIAQADSAERDWQLTRAVVDSLAKVMLIKDELYVAALLTDPEKYAQDQRRFNVDPSRGERIAYSHFHRLEFELFGQSFGFDWHSRDWHLRLIQRLPVLRRFARRTYRRELAFREWYRKQLRHFDEAVVKDPREYRRWVQVLGAPEPVTGFRSVRWPKIEAARRKARRLLAMEASEFEQASESKPSKSTQTRDHGRDAREDSSVSLPVITADDQPQ